MSSDGGGGSDRRGSKPEERNSDRKTIDKAIPPDDLPPAVDLASSQSSQVKRPPCPTPGDVPPADGDVDKRMIETKINKNSLVDANALRKSAGGPESASKEVVRVCETIRSSARQSRGVSVRTIETLFSDESRSIVVETTDEATRNMTVEVSTYPSPREVTPSLRSGESGEVKHPMKHPFIVHDGPELVMPTEPELPPGHPPPKDDDVPKPLLSTRRNRKVSFQSHQAKKQDRFVAAGEDPQPCEESSKKDHSLDPETDSNLEPDSDSNASQNMPRTWPPPNSHGAFRVSSASQDGCSPGNASYSVDNLRESQSTALSATPVHVEATLVDQEAEQEAIRMALQQELHEAHEQDLIAAREHERQLALDHALELASQQKARILGKVSRRAQLVCCLLAFSLVAVAVTVSVITSNQNGEEDQRQDPPPTNPQDSLKWTQLGNDMKFLSRYSSDDENSNRIGDTIVSMSSDGWRIAVAAPLKDKNGITDSGHIAMYQYDQNSSDWKQLGRNVADAPIGLGSLIAMSDDGKHVAVARASLLESLSCPAVKSRGNLYPALMKYIRVYELADKDWIRVGDEFYGECNGDGITHLSISANGTHVAAGGRGVPCKVYENKNGNWTQIGQDIANDGGNGMVSLSADANHLAVVNTHFVGQASVFAYEDGSWHELWSSPGIDVDYGYTMVVLSANGKRLGIAAASSSPTTHDAQHQLDDLTRVYRESGSSWLQVGGSLISLSEVVGTDFRSFRGSSFWLSGDGDFVCASANVNASDVFEVMTVVLQYSNISKSWDRVGNIIKSVSTSKNDFDVRTELSHHGTCIAISFAGITRVLVLDK